MYVIVHGEGTILLDGDEARVVAGSAVCIPPGATHAIRNTGSVPLEYVAATVPPLEPHTLWREPRAEKAERSYGPDRP